MRDTAFAGSGRIDPRYFVVLGGCMVQFTVIGLLFSYGVLIKVFETEFGWSRSTLSAGGSLAFLVMGLTAIFAGRLNDLFGPRVVLLCSGLSCGLGYALISQVTAPWQLLTIMALLFGLGLSTHDVVTLSTVARWFPRRRGIMTGVVKVGTAVGQMTIPAFCAFLVIEIGWQSATLSLGLTAIVLLTIAALIMKTPPKPSEAVATATGVVESHGATFAEIRRTRVFWTLCAAQFLFFPTLTTVPLHIVIHGTDMGLNAATAAILLTVTGGASIVGRLTIGTLSDRIRGRQAYVLCFLPLIASLAALVLIHSPWPLFAAMAVYGFGHGGFFTVVSPTLAEYFGTRAHGTAFGAVLFFGTIGGALGPTLAGWVFDEFGSYTLAFGTLGGMAVAGLALILSLPRSEA